MAASTMQLLLCVFLFTFSMISAYPNSGFSKFVKGCSRQNKCIVKHAIYAGGRIFIHLKQINGTSTSGPVTIKYTVTSGRCYNGKDGSAAGAQCEGSVKVPHSDRKLEGYLNASVVSKVNDMNCNFSMESSGTEKGGFQPGPFNYSTDQPLNYDMITVREAEVYTVTIWIEDKPPNVAFNVIIAVLNSYGFLDAADCPSLIFYVVMLVAYIVIGLVWSVCLCCSCKDIIRLQLFIGVAIIMGFFEKLLFVIEYICVTETGESSSDSSFFSLLLIAEGISAGKKMFARVLFIIISSGFGTVKPRLGPLLWKVAVYGLIFFLATFADGVVRSQYYKTVEGFGNQTIITLVLQVVLDAFCLYWVLTNLIDTRRTLKLRRNGKKLTFYNHLLVVFLFMAVGILAFLLWILVTGLMKDCNESWRVLWLKEDFWPLLFTILLVVIMFLWRPSSNTIRFAYSVVSNEDDDGEIQQKANENFETMKMRQSGKPVVLPPKPSTETEEDLKWVEENLPASTIDQVLQPLMDSDEELMTTRFELSKMD